MNGSEKGKIKEEKEGGSEGGTEEKKGEEGREEKEHFADVNLSQGPQI